MTQLVSLARVKQFNHVFISDDDALLNALIPAASQAVMDYLGMTDADVLDSDGTQPFDSDGNPEGVELVEQIATAILVGKLYDGMDAKELDYGRLPKEVTSMLYIRRQEMGLA